MQFCYPSICDGRDLLEDIIGKAWNPSTRLLEIIENIQKFLLHFIKNLQESNLLLVGKYYLQEKYDITLMKALPNCIFIYIYRF